MGSDLRVRMTKQLINDTFFALLEKMPLGKITVKGICDTAGIHRSTFYKYYANPYHLMETIQAELIDEMNAFLKTLPDLNITDAVMDILHHLMTHKDIYKTILSKNGDPHFIDRMLREIYTAKQDSIESLFPDLTQAQKEWVFQFITYGSTQIIVTWVKHDFDQPPAHVAEFINKLNTIMLEGLAGRL